MGLGKRMVHGEHPALFRVVLEERKIDDPEKLERGRIAQIEFARELESQIAHQGPYDALCARHQQERVARRKADCLGHTYALFVADVPRDRSLPSAVAGFGPRAAES